MNELGKHEHGKGSKMKPDQGFRGAFVTPHQALKARYLAKTALAHPASGQEHKTLLGLHLS